MRISIVIPIYNSHEAVRRQVKHFKRMNLPDDIEFIFVDDGSNPPLKESDYDLKNLRIIATHDKRPWTQGLARNAGAKVATGEYLFMTDIDQIISKEAIDDVYNFTGDKMIFKRYIAVLTAEGELTQDKTVLTEYGCDIKRFQTSRGLYASVHGNTFAMKKTTLELLGGYNPKRCMYGHHASEGKGEDSYFNHAWNKYARKNNIVLAVGSDMYIFPTGRYNSNNDLNPMNLFHELSYEQTKQPMKK